MIFSQVYSLKILWSSYELNKSWLHWTENKQPFLSWLAATLGWLLWIQTLKIPISPFVYVRGSFRYHLILPEILPFDFTFVLSLGTLVMRYSFFPPTLYVMAHDISSKFCFRTGPLFLYLIFFSPCNGSYAARTRLTFCLAISSVKSKSSLDTFFISQVSQITVLSSVLLPYHTGHYIFILQYHFITIFPNFPSRLLLFYRLCFSPSPKANGLCLTFC